MKKRIVARWETKGKDYLELTQSTLPDGRVYYSYEGRGCGGGPGLDITTDEAAIAWMEHPWATGHTGPVTVLKSDRPSLKRVL